MQEGRVKKMGQLIALQDQIVHVKRHMDLFILLPAVPDQPVLQTAFYIEQIDIFPVQDPFLQYVYIFAFFKAEIL